MEQLLSKELMYEPMKQVTEKFPLWLEQNKNKISEKEWNQRNNQYGCFQKLVQVYEEQDNDNSSNNNNNNGTTSTGRLLELMQQVQEYGQPPCEIINEIAPGLEL
ncbi:Pex19 protein, partial [Fragilariopsis cylindrus CCMP1102]